MPEGPQLAVSHFFEKSYQRLDHITPVVAHDGALTPVQIAEFLLMQDLLQCFFRGMLHRSIVCSMSSSRCCFGLLHFPLSSATCQVPQGTALQSPRRSLRMVDYNAEEKQCDPHVCLQCG